MALKKNTAVLLGYISVHNIFFKNILKSLQKHKYPNMF